MRLSVDVRHANELNEFSERIKYSNIRGQSRGDEAERATMRVSNEEQDSSHDECDVEETDYFSRLRTTQLVRCDGQLSEDRNDELFQRILKDVSIR